MTFQRNDVVLVPFPFSDLSTTKARPAVFVGAKPVLFTLDPARVLHRIGSLTPTDMAQVDQRLLRALAL